MNSDAHEKQHNALIELFQHEHKAMSQLITNVEKIMTTNESLINTVHLIKIINGILWVITLASLSLAVWNFVVAQHP